MIMNNTQYALVVGSSKIMCTFQKETDLSWQSFLQTSTKRIHSAMKSLSRVTLKNLQPDSLYQICSMMEINVEGTEESTVCTPSNNFSCDNLVHTRTCEESVPAVQNLTVHLDIEERVVLSWLPPKSKCTTLFEYRVIQLPERLSSKVSSGGRFWSNATDIVTWPTKPCIGFPERHCHLLGFTSEQIFHVQVERIQDGALSKPAVTYRRIPILGPGRPRGLEVVATRAQSLVLRWRVPLVPGPLLAHALVSVHAVEGAYVRKHSVCVRGQALMEYEVCGLRSGTLFNVSVNFSSKNGDMGEPVSVQGRTADEERGPSSKPNISTTMDKLPRANVLQYVIITQRPFSISLSEEQLEPKTNASSSRESSVGNERNRVRATTNPTSLRTFRPTVRPKIMQNFTDLSNELGLPGGSNTTAKCNGSRITVPDSLPKTDKPFNPSWKIITLFCLAFFALAIASFIAGYCMGRQAAQSRDSKSRSIFWGCCDENSDAYEAVAGAGFGGGRWARSRMRLPGSFHEYEDLNASRRRGPWAYGHTREHAATLDSNASRSTGYSEYFFRGRLPRLVSAAYSAASSSLSAGLPLLHVSHQHNPAFDPHEYEDVAHPPPYEVTKTENRFSQRILQPLNPAELLESQMASNLEPSSITATQTARERTF